MAKTYSNYSLKNKSTMVFTSAWAHKEGVFQTPHGTWIARVNKGGNNFTTLSQHKTESEAQEVYNNFYFNNPLTTTSE